MKIQNQIKNDLPRPTGRGIEVKNKMINKLTNPRLRRLNVVVNGFHSRVPNTTKEFSRTPEVSFPKVSSKPRMFLKKLVSTITLKQLKSHANTHSRGHLNKQVDVVSPNIELINLEPFSVSNLPKEEFTIHPQPVKLEGVSCVFNFPHKVEGVLSEAMLPRFQIHFLSPKSTGDTAHANFSVYFEESSISTLPNSQTEELNLMEDGDSSPNLKVWVSSP